MKCEQTEQSWCLVLVGSSLNVVLQLYENITHKQSKQQRLTVLKYTGQLSLAIPLWEGAVRTCSGHNHRRSTARELQSMSPA